MAQKDFSADFQLIGNRIVQLKINNDFITLDMDEDSEIKKGLHLSHQIVSVQTDPQGKLSGLLLIHVKVKLSRAKDKCNVDLMLEGCFNAEPDLGEEKFRSMLEINGFSTLYSIARSTLISISSQTFNRGTIILPMINVFKYIESQKELLQEKEDKTKK